MLVKAGSNQAFVSMCSSSPHKAHQQPPEMKWHLIQYSHHRQGYWAEHGERGKLLPGIVGTEDDTKQLRAPKTHENAIFILNTLPCIICKLYDVIFSLLYQIYTTKIKHQCTYNVIFLKQKTCNLSISIKKVKGLGFHDMYNI